MKKLLFVIFIAVACALDSSAQSVGDGVKIEKEKHFHHGMKVVGGGMKWSLNDDYESGMEPSIGAYWFMSGLIKPSIPESHWGMNFGIGFEWSKVSVCEEKLDKSSDAVRIFPMFVGVKYILNPLSTRGKWDISADLDIGLLDVFPTVSGEKYRDLTSKFGLDAGICLSLNYSFSRWMIGIGGKAALCTQWSASDDSKSCSCYGAFAQLAYIF